MAMIVGRSLASAFPPKCADAAPPVNFTVKGLSTRTVRDVGFAVGRGQIIGIAGVEGNGQSELGMVLAGLLVGYGTRLGCGCTSGHGVCGLARLSPRSLVATLTFMVTTFATVTLIRHGFGG